MEIEIIENNAIEVLQKMKNITIAKKDIIELINTFFKKKQIQIHSILKS